MPYNCWDDCEKGDWFSNPLVQAWIFSGFLFASITATMFFNVILPAAVLLYDFHIFITSSSSFHGFNTNQFNNLLPVGLLVQLVERCSGIAEVKGSNPVQAWIFFRLSFRNCKSCVYNCDDLLSYNSSPRSSHIWFSSSHNFIIVIVSFEYQSNRELKQRRFWVTHVNGKWGFFPFNMPWCYQNCIVQYLYS